MDVVARRRRWQRRACGGGALGLLVAAALSVADLVGLSGAVGYLFDPTPHGFLLVALAVGVQLLLGCAAGVLVSLVWPARLRLRGAWGVGALGLACVGLAAASYATRLHRRLPDLPPPGSVQGSGADVLFIVVDTLRADSLYGAALDFPLAPAVRRFASEALMFTDAESAAGWTMPAMATLQTGLDPTRLGAERKLLPAWAPTLAERLHAAGYATHAVVDNALLEPQTGFAAGFMSYAQRSALRFAHSLVGLRILPASVRRQLRGAWPVAYHGCPGVTEAALQVMRRERGRPLYLYVHYMDPHAPYYPHEGLPAPPAGARAVNRAEVLARAGKAAELSLAELAYLKHAYENEVRFVDKCIGELLAAWAQRPTERITLLTADHGEEFLEHGELGHGHSVYAELVHVPLVLQLPPAVLPQARRRGRVDVPVSHIDVVPTLLEALRLAHDVGGGGVALQGRSWLPYLRGEAPAPARALYAAQDSQGRRLARYRQGAWVLIDNLSGPRQGRSELYDKTHDYAELRDLAATSVALRESLRRALAEHRGNSAPLAAETGGAMPSVEAMRALGYIQ